VAVDGGGAVLETGSVDSWFVLRVKPTKSVGVHADWEFPNSEHAIGLVGPELVGLHTLFVANGYRGGDLGPNHSLWRERIDFRVW